MECRAHLPQRNRQEVRTGHLTVARPPGGAADPRDDIRKDRAAEVAFFDVYPPDDEAEFNGSWSNYPFFASGNVVVSGIEEGLLVLRPTLARGKGGKGGPK